MKKLILLDFILILFVINSYSQSIFLGFEQSQCGLIENHGYTYTNERGTCSSHSAIYKIFLNDNLVYEKPCEYLQFYYVDTMFFINDSTGFIIVKYLDSNYIVYKTKDYGASWLRLGWGGPTYWGFYLVNANNVYLITGANGSGPLITRASDIENKNPPYYDITITGNEAIINDTISGNPLCGHDTLSFKVIDGTDTITYIIALKSNPLPNATWELPVAQFEVYPNPCSDYVCFPQNVLKNEVWTCKIYSVDVNLVMTDKIIDNCVYVKNLKSGIYLIIIQNGNTIMTTKIIKQ